MRFLSLCVTFAAAAFHGSSELLAGHGAVLKVRTPTAAAVAAPAAVRRPLPNASLFLAPRPYAPMPTADNAVVRPRRPVVVNDANIAVAPRKPATEYAVMYGSGTDCSMGESNAPATTKKPQEEEEKPEEGTTEKPEEEGTTEKPEEEERTTEKPEEEGTTEKPEEEKEGTTEKPEEEKEGTTEKPEEEKEGTTEKPEEEGTPKEQMTPPPNGDLE